MVSPFQQSEEHRYFLEIELLFNTLRGSASLLSPADWQIAKDWWRQQIPLTVVHSALENVFLQRRERGDAGSVQRLSYCAPAVENAFQNLKELGYGQYEPERQGTLLERLERLVQSLEAGDPEGKLPEGEECTAHDYREAVLACYLEGDDASEVERKLARLETQLAERSLEALAPEQRQLVDSEIDAKVEQATAKLRSRVDPETLERTRSKTRERLLREAMSIPRLSLFL